MESNQTAARAAKRFLEDRIRSDWAYPDVPPEWSASDEEVRDARDFRERYYGESESGDSSGGEEAGPYRFDGPDSIGDVVARTREARRKRRRERLEAEMQDNPGLRIWVERRDLWTGAASVKKYGTRQRRASPDSTIAETFDVVPVAPRLLDSNPIRASITPKAYPDIYQKIVVSARTPSVPINLGDMTKALVQGWKDSDEWPPRAALADPLAGKKRSITGMAVNGHEAGFIHRHPHLEKSVDSVKRILHLNGGHPEGGKAT
ncbi:hypothetical protein CC86DRAFT_391781 [Ophiobolus disseminans]|uniref:Gag1-like clamp domain-containing protein n=1 Tax=Ophiobolus disseminans TaxID=1469910 RepID=A0A6A7A8Q5_9PLEO|nr:hypothetical protein CC86DRAFT_391781 [Ophiobolus disseminans]